MLLSALAEAYASVSDLESPLEVPAIVVTGSHNASVHAVRHGCCDLVAIDCVSLALGVLHHSSFLEGVRIIGWTKPAFALPYVTHKHVTDSTLRSIRKGLTAMLNSSDMGVLKARQQSLLVGIDMSDHISVSSYQEAVNLHSNLANQIYTIISTAPDKAKLKSFGCIMDSKWPSTDFQFVYSLKCEIFQLLKCALDDQYARLSATESSHFLDSSIPKKRSLTVTSIDAAISPLTRKIIWRTGALGGKIKMIFPSQQRVVAMLVQNISSYGFTISDATTMNLATQDIAFSSRLGAKFANTDASADLCDMCKPGDRVQVRRDRG
jgi:hypothetical protein